MVFNVAHLAAAVADSIKHSTHSSLFVSNGARKKL